MTTITDLSKRALKLAKERDDKIAMHRKIAQDDPMMTTEGKTQYVDGWQKAARRDYDAAMAELKEEVAYTTRQLERDNARLRPTFDPSSAADLTRTEQAWRNNVLPQLERGRSLAAALRDASRDDVIGAERFAASWLEGRSAPQSLASALAGEGRKDWSAVVRQAATNRYADLLGGEDGETLRAAERIGQETETFRNVAAQVEYGRPGLDTAIALHYAAQDAPVEDGSDGDSADNAA